jgi:hypothetical protein
MHTHAACWWCEVGLSVRQDSGRLCCIVLMCILTLPSHPHILCGSIWCARSMHHVRQITAISVLSYSLLVFILSFCTVMTELPVPYTISVRFPFTLPCATFQTFRRNIYMYLISSGTLVFHARDLNNPNGRNYLLDQLCVLSLFWFSHIHSHWLTRWRRI